MISCLPAARLTDPDYVQIGESSEDVKMLSHYSAPQLWHLMHAKVHFPDTHGTVCSKHVLA